MAAYGWIALFGLLGLLVAASAYAAVAWALWRRCALCEGPVEHVEVELETPGATISLSHYPPEAQRYAEPVILCHGLGANRYNLDFCDDGQGSDRLSIARYLQRAGFDIWVLELRGRGRAKAPPGALWDADAEAREDVPTAIETVLDLTGASQVIWLGHSWGGLLAYLFLSSGHPLAEKVRGLVTLGSPASVTHHRFPRFLLWLVKQRAKLARPVPLIFWARLGLPVSPFLHLGLRVFAPYLLELEPGVLRRIFASLADDVNAGVLRQMVHWMERGELAEVNGPSYEQRYDRIRTPLLLIAGAIDPLAPAASVESLAHRVGSTDVTFKIMSRAHGASWNFGHGGLLVGRHAPDDVYPLVAHWIAQRATPATEAA